MTISERSVLQIAPGLPRDVRNQLSALDNSGLLHSVTAPLHFSETRTAVRRFPSGLRRYVENRAVPEAISDRTDCDLSAEFLRAVSSVARRAIRKQGNADRWMGRLDTASIRSISSKLRLIVAREDCCLRTFRAAKNVGIQTVYDLPIADHRTMEQILRREYAEFPGASTEPSPNADFVPSRCARKREELRLSDAIVVPSQFVRNSLVAARVPKNRIHVIPFGLSASSAYTHTAGGSPNSGKPIVLVVGHLSLRKGTPRLLRVWKRLGAYRTHRLVLVGRNFLTSRYLSDYKGVFEHVPHIPRSQLQSYYQSASAFVLPSAAEGFAVVITEAMSYGLPVIVSSNSGAVGVLEHGRDGLIFPFGDDDALCEALNCVLTDTQFATELGRSAAKLSQTWTWGHYREAFVNVVRGVLADG